MLIRGLKLRALKTAVLLAWTGCIPFLGQADDTLVVFGLTNQALNGATLVTGESLRGLRVEGLGEEGHQGMSVLLGQADSGLFFSPQLQEQPELGNTMSANVFGKAGEHERLLGTVSCRKSDWGLYPFTVDFSAIGASNYIVQVFCYDKLGREETNSTGEITFHTDSAGNLYPRVNPCWRAPDGSVGVLVEFVTSLVNLEHGSAYGNRVFIKPQTPHSAIDYVSRVDIYGGGGLTYFEGWGEWLGMYSLPHLALGTAVMRANQGVLSVGGLGESGEDGLMVELGGAGAYEMDLQPMPLQTNGTVSLSANGVGDLYYFEGRQFLGPVHLHDTNGVTEVGGTFGSDSTNRVLISMLQDGAMTGRIDTENGAWGSISNGTWKITAFGVRPAEGTNRSAIYVKFDTQVSFVPGGTQTALTGNQMLFSWQEGPDADSFQNFQVQGSGLPGFSITNVVTTPASPERFSIVRSGPDIQFSWPYRLSSTYLRSAQNITDPFTTTNLPSYELKGPRWQFTIAAGGAPQEFFQLWDWCLEYNRYLDHD